MGQGYKECARETDYTLSMMVMADEEKSKDEYIPTLVNCKIKVPSSVFRT